MATLEQLRLAATVRLAPVCAFARSHSLATLCTVLALAQIGNAVSVSLGWTRYSRILYFTDSILHHLVAAHATAPAPLQLPRLPPIVGPAAAVAASEAAQRPLDTKTAFGKTMDSVFGQLSAAWQHFRQEEQQQDVSLGPQQLEDVRFALQVIAVSACTC